MWLLRSTFRRAGHRQTCFGKLTQKRSLWAIMHRLLLNPRGSMREQERWIGTRRKGESVSAGLTHLWKEVWWFRPKHTKTNCSFKDENEAVVVGLTLAANCRNIEGMATESRHKASLEAVLMWRVVLQSKKQCYKRKGRKGKKRGSGIVTGTYCMKREAACVRGYATCKAARPAAQRRETVRTSSF